MFPPLPTHTHTHTHAQERTCSVTELITSTNVLNASVLVKRSPESAQTTHVTACTLAQMMMLTRSHSHVLVERFSSEMSM